MGWFSNSRQRQVLRLEPSRGASAIGNFLVFLIAGAIATAYELQRTIDLVPIERVMLLCDPQSSRRFLRSAVERAWIQMSADSPNATGAPRTATIAVTDSIRRYRSQQGDQEFERVRLESSRRQSRRVAADAQVVAEAALRDRPHATGTP